MKKVKVRLNERKTKQFYEIIEDVLYLSEDRKTLVFTGHPDDYHHHTTFYVKRKGDLDSFLTVAYEISLARFNKTLHGDKKSRRLR